MNEKEIVIIGAGLTGLTTAFYLKQRGKRVLIVEKAPRAGGDIRTFRENGYIYESGPNTGALSNPEIAELFEQLSGCRLQTAKKEAHRRLIYKNGVLRALPGGLFTALATTLFTWRDKFGILLEPFRRRGKNPDETVAALVIRRLGSSFLSYAVDPFISGIYAGDPDMLVTRYALPKLYALEARYGSFIRGAIRKAGEPRTGRDKKATKEVFTAEGGLGNLVDALVHAIGEDNIILGNHSLQVEGKAHCWMVRMDNCELTVPHVISTVGAYVIPSIFTFAPRQLLTTINNVRYARVVQVSVGMKQLPGMDTGAFGALMPSVEHRETLGILYPSSCFAGRCPEGKVLLSVFMGGMRRPEVIDMTDHEIEETVRRELGNLYGAKPDDYEYMRIFRHPYAIPQYEINTGDRLQAIEEFQHMYPGIILAGNLRDGIGMGHRVKQAAEIAGSFE